MALTSYSAYKTAGFKSSNEWARRWTCSMRLSIVLNIARRERLLLCSKLFTLVGPP